MDQFEEKLNNMLLNLEKVKELYKNNNIEEIASILKYVSMDLMNLSLINMDNVLKLLTGERKQNEEA